LDKNVPFRQEISSREIAVVILRARSSRIEDLVPFIPECLAMLQRIGPGQVVRVGSVRSTR
jgi:hypothetical protein